MMQRPATSAARVVFPWDAHMNAFSKREFNPVSTQGRVSDADIERVFQALKQSPNYKIPNMLCLILMIPCIMIGGMILMMVLIFSSASSSSSSSGPSSTIFLPFLIMPLLFCGIMGIMCYAASSRNKALRGR
jgi:hypothetical protein